MHLTSDDFNPNSLNVLQGGNISDEKECDKFLIKIINNLISLFCEDEIKN